MSANKVNIEGAGRNSLEIVLCSNGDFLVSVTTFDTVTGRRELTANFPNPVNGGGNLRAYQRVKKVYEILRSKK